MSIRKKNPSSKWNLESLFVIDSFSVLSEYVNQHHQQIIHLIGDQKSLDAFCRQNPALKKVCCLKSVWLEKHKEIPTRARVWALVKIDIKGEECLSSLSSKNDSSLIVAVDHISDPRNFGAIVRSASYFGSCAILFPKNRQSPLTDVVVRSAQGGFAHVDPIMVTNLSRSLKSLKKDGYWIVGADVGGDLALGDKSLDLDKVVVVLGSEDKGLSRIVKEQCDFRVSITGKGNRVGSLNVSVAAGLIFHNFFHLSK
jgi:predicted rRNA methylase